MPKVLFRFVMRCVQERKMSCRNMPRVATMTPTAIDEAFSGACEEVFPVVLATGVGVTGGFAVLGKGVGVWLLRGVVVIGGGVVTTRLTGPDLTV